MKLRVDIIISTWLDLEVVCELLPLQLHAVRDDLRLGHLNREVRHVQGHQGQYLREKVGWIKIYQQVGCRESYFENALESFHDVRYVGERFDILVADRGAQFQHDRYDVLGVMLKKTEGSIVSPFFS